MSWQCLFSWYTLNCDHYSLSFTLCVGVGFQVIDARQRADRMQQPAEEEPSQALGPQHSSHDMDALTEPRSSAEEDARMPEPATEAPAQQPHTATQHSDASGGFAVDFGDTATSSEGKALAAALATCHM